MKLGQSLFKVLKKYFYTDSGKYQYPSHILKEWDLAAVRRITEVIANGLFILASFAWLLVFYRTKAGLFKWYDLIYIGISLGFFSLFIRSWYTFLRQGWREK